MRLQPDFFLLPMSGIYIKLEPTEMRGLGDLAKIERRDMRDQAAILVRERLIELGLLPKPNSPAPALEVKP